jgi:hypothetical protein
MSNIMSNNREHHIERYDAVEQSDGSYLHNDGDVYWYNEAGLNHKEDGPAVIRHYGMVLSWYYLGINYTFSEWCVAAKKTDEQKLLLRLQYA